MPIIFETVLFGLLITNGECKPNRTLLPLLPIGDASVGKSAITQVFHSDGSHFPKNYSMVRMS